MSAHTISQPESFTDLMSLEQAYDTLWRHQPTSNGFSYERHCAVCGGMVPCSSRREAEGALARHGHYPFPTPVQIETARRVSYAD